MLKTFSFIILFAFSSTNLFAQSINFSNSIESHLSSIFVQQLNEENVIGTGFGISYHRSILHHEVFKPYFGLELNYFELHIQNTYPSEEDFYFYQLFSVQKSYPIGVLIGNRFSKNFNKMNIFLDTELSSNLVIGNNIDTKLRHLRIGFDYSELPPAIDQEGDYSLFRILFKFGIRTGFEYSFTNRFSIFLAPSWFKTLNSIYKETELSPNIPKINKKFINIISLSLGARF